jgi:hypothetical protein
MGRWHTIAREASRGRCRLAMTGAITLAFATTGQMLDTRQRANRLRISGWRSSAIGLTWPDYWPDRLIALVQTIVIARRFGLVQTGFYEQRSKRDQPTRNRNWIRSRQQRMTPRSSVAPR